MVDLITVPMLQNLRACERAIQELKGYFKEKNISSISLENLIEEIIARNLFPWGNWLLTRLFTQSAAVAYAVYSAKRVLHIYENVYPDDLRPRHAIEAAERYLNGTITTADAAKAATNAADAATVAGYAAYTADAATRATNEVNTSYAASHAAYSAYAAAEATAHATDATVRATHAAYADRADYAASDAIYAAAYAYAAADEVYAYAYPTAADTPHFGLIKSKILNFGLRLITNGV